MVLSPDLLYQTEAVLRLSVGYSLRLRISSTVESRTRNSEESRFFFEFWMILENSNCKLKIKHLLFCFNKVYFINFQFKSTDINSLSLAYHADLDLKLVSFLNSPSLPLFPSWKMKNPVFNPYTRCSNQSGCCRDGGK